MAAFDDLQKKAKELHIPTNSGVYKPNSEAWTELQITEYELHRRIKEEERHQREHNMWLAAAFSAAVSVIAALGAWAAVLMHR
jgi:hypothetical protein